VNQSQVKAELESTLSVMLTKVQDGKLKIAAEFGRFFCSVENFDHFAIVQRKFETAEVPMNIPFSDEEPSVQMLFSMDGQSVFNDRFNPFILSPASHCINFFNRYECRNLLGENAHQHDIAFRLKKGFYTHLIANNFPSSEGSLPAMILHQKEFNTINQHIRSDAGILGILKNIMDCPFKGNMRSAFMREHIRALLTLQLFHFNTVVTGKKIAHDRKISKRDEDILRDVKHYIDEHFLDSTSLDMLSKHFGINEFKLKHGFRVLFDASPIRYLQYKRLVFSLLLLRDTNKTIKTIADEIGYAHAANFTTAFTKTFGHSPLYYRAGGRGMHVLSEVETDEVIV
jgi:AraC-like DNA-binding protein